MLDTQLIKTFDITKLTVMLENKEKAAEDLNRWLMKHDSKESEYKRVLSDRSDLAGEIEQLKAEIIIRNKPFVKSLNETFEL